MPTLSPIYCRLVLAAGLAVLVPTLAQAQIAPPAPGAVAERDYDIAAGPLGRALAQFAQQSGVPLIADPALVSQRHSLGLRGRLTVAAGLAALLRETGLVAVRDGAGYALRRSGSAAVAELRPLTVTGDAIASPAAQVYTAPRSTVYVSSEELDRFSAISIADVLKGQPGVQVGDARNGGALDVNIRGIQGQSRVAVTVDGAQQAIDTYRGYAGTQQRSYMDQDFLKDITISKGPGFSLDTPGAAAAIGGSVNFRTIDASDIVKPGRRVGIRLKGELWNNGASYSKPYLSATSRAGLYVEPRSSRPSLFGAAARSGSLVAAYTGDKTDLLFGYSQRTQGNYFSGKYGRDRYREYGRSGEEFPTTATIYFPGSEVLNSSNESQTTLFKASLRIAPAHRVQLSHMRYRGTFGEIMPSDIIRYADAGVSQFKPGTMDIATTTARYAYTPGNDLIDLKAGLWMTEADNDQLNNGSPPSSLTLTFFRGATQQRDRRYGADLGNRARLATGAGDFTLDLSGAFQYQDMQPQKGVVYTQRDRDFSNVLRDANRSELTLGARLAYEPTPDWEFWTAGRYTRYRVRDRNPTAIGLYRETVLSPWWTERVRIGTRYEPPIRRSDAAFRPSLGVQYRYAPESTVYVSYNQGIRMPSLFETTEGSSFISTTHRSLLPERSRNLELGVSAVRAGVLTGSDQLAMKLAYFDNRIDNYITRYFRWRDGESLEFSNTDYYRTRGFEWQSRYDSGRYVADLSTTYTLQTTTCDRQYASYLRGTFLSTRAAIPDCTDGAFSGSYVGTQNPPKLAVNLTAATRLLAQRLTLGGRLVYTSGPLVKMTRVWQDSATTNQILYQPVLLLDAFASFQVNDSVTLSAAVQNLTDRYYLDPLALSYMPAPGRTFRLAFTGRF